MRRRIRERSAIWVGEREGIEGRESNGEEDDDDGSDERSLENIVVCHKWNKLC